MVAIIILQMRGFGLVHLGSGKITGQWGVVEIQLEPSHFNTRSSFDVDMSVCHTLRHSQAILIRATFDFSSTVDRDLEKRSNGLR